MKKIIIAVDNSAFSEKILIKGSELAVSAGASCTVVSVVPPIVYLPEGGFPSPIIPPEEIFEAGKTSVLNFINDVISRNNLAITDIIIRQGDAADEVINITAETAGDTIVIGTHGRTGIDHLLAGSVAEQIIRHSVVPVFVIPQKYLQQP